VRDYVDHVSSVQEDERRRVRHRILSALVAVGVSLLGWGMIVALLVWSR
jgi:hypothetical protein